MPVILTDDFNTGTVPDPAKWAIYKDAAGSPTYVALESGVMHAFANNNNRWAAALDVVSNERTQLDATFQLRGNKAGTYSGTYYVHLAAPSTMTHPTQGLYIMWGGTSLSTGVAALYYNGVALNGGAGIAAALSATMKNYRVEVTATEVRTKSWAVGASEPATWAYTGALPSGGIAAGRFGITGHNSYTGVNANDVGTMMDNLSLSAPESAPAAVNVDLSVSTATVSSVGREATPETNAEIYLLSASRKQYTGTGGAM